MLKLAPWLAVVALLSSPAPAQSQALKRAPTRKARRLLAEAPPTAPTAAPAAESSPAATEPASPSPAPAPEAAPPVPTAGAPAAPEYRFFRDGSEYFAYRSARHAGPTDPSPKIITDFKRFDVGVGKRLPLVAWGEKGKEEGWVAGVDGGMLASLVRYTNQGRLTFATVTFDGMFGAFVGFHNAAGWIAMFRTAHLSAHLVDNSPQYLSPIGYSQFWNELMVGKTFPAPGVASDWEAHVQGSVGLNNTSTPFAKQPRASVGADFGYAFCGPDSLGAIASADVLRAGVQDQDPSYTFFAGLGYLSRPETRHRPFRFGLSHFRGSDYRNQRFSYKHVWTAFLLAAEF